MHSLEGGQRRGSATCCNVCYAWASFLIWTAIIFLLIFGIAFFAFVRSNLPEIKVHRLDVYKLNVTEPMNKNNDKQLTVDVQIMVNVTNNNKKMTLVYGKLHVETKVEGFSLPNVRLDGFKQNTMTTNDLKIRPKVMRLGVNDDEAKQLNMTANHHELVLKLKMKGKIQFWFKGRVVSNLHLMVSCNGVEQSQIDQAIAHKCNVKLQLFS
ncbi:hypothetical protein M8C21_014577 [Ambrosia artemisiifolia]|uniref:Late embryogenesis abundant protein LEA-2 subgroup domain-containing protein n=1 Tax=Ambrosia artemisiifolia TaxID=4212 RepID=A0AAD5BS10_AMBAR|nr:hypothetical protein M8C21_014577 [Ambrosia artemisiifolia]